MSSTKAILKRMASCVLAACLSFGIPAQGVLAAGSAGSAVSGQPIPTTRLAGKDRYATMVEIVREAFPKSSAWAVIATGESFPDALCAAAIAGVRHCPVILTARGSLSAAARAELERLDVRHAYIVGGSAAVKPNVESTIHGMDISVERLSGADRYATSIAVAREVRELTGSNSLAIATGAEFADALSLGPWCYATSSPVICVPKGGTLSKDAISEIASGSYTSAVIAGGKAAVSDAVETQVGKIVDVERLSGSDRYETSVKVAQWSCNHGLSWKTPAIATGKNFPDALAGSAMQGALGSPLLLAGGSSEAIASVLKEHNSQISKANILGGTGAVSEAFVSAVTGKEDPRAQAREVADKLVEGDRSRELSTYRYADVCGGPEEELLLEIKSEEGSGWTFYIYTFEGSTRKLYESGGYPSAWYDFYKETSSFVAYGFGHGGEWYRVATMVDGTYQDCASKVRNPSTKGGGASDGPWTYTTTDSGTCDEDTYESLLSRLTKGRATRVTNSGDGAWSNLY